MFGNKPRSWPNFSSRQKVSSVRLFAASHTRHWHGPPFPSYSQYVLTLLGNECLLIYSQLLTSGIQQHDDMLKYLESVNHVQLYWKIYDEMNPDCPDVHGFSIDDINDARVKLYSHIIEYQAYVICHLSSSQASRAWQSITASIDWKDKGDKVDELSGRCKEYISYTSHDKIQRNWKSQLKEMYESRKVLNEIYHALEKERTEMRRNYDKMTERELMETLATTHEEYKNFNPKKVPDTCQWFLNHSSFRNWRNSTSSRLLWVSAGPGCGKSVLSRSLIDERQLSNSIATSTTCYFFFKEGDNRRMKSADAISAILHQLFVQDRKDRTLISHAIATFESYGRNLRDNFEKLWDILITCASSPDVGEIVCVLDALDECTEEGRRTIIDKLEEFFSETEEISKPSQNLKFLITSRPNEDIERRFRKLASTSAYLRLDGDGESYEIGREINIVIEAEAPSLLSDFNPKDRERITQRLKNMGSRTYLWLDLTFRIIKDNPSEYSRPSDIEDLLSDLPDTVTGAYEKILSRTKNQKRIKTLFEIMLAAERPLSLKEADYALTLALEKQGFPSYAAVQQKVWGESFETMVRNQSGFFVQTHGSRLSFMHQTAREFLISGDSGVWQGCLSLPAAHATMTLCCTRCLLLPDIAEAFDQYRFSGVEAPFLKYAVTKWISHYKSQDQSAKEKSRLSGERLGRISGAEAQTWAALWIEVTSQYSWREWFGWTDLAFASYFGLDWIIEDILNESNIDIDEVGGYYGTAVNSASAAGNTKVVEMLLKYNCNINIPGEKYSTAIQAAVSEERMDVIALLLNKSEDEVQITKDILIAIAGKVNGKGIMDLLLKKKGDQVQITKDILKAIAENWNGKEMIDLLLEKRGDQVQITEDILKVVAGNQVGEYIMVLMLTERYHDVVIHLNEAVCGIAAANGQHGILDLIYRHTGLSTNQEEWDDIATFHNASRDGDIQTVTELLARGVSPDFKDAYGRTPFWLAAERGHEQVIQYLIQRSDIDINSKDISGQTPIFWPTARGNEKMVKLLLGAGADPKIQDKNGYTAISIARRRGHSKVLQLLLSV